MLKRKGFLITKDISACVCDICGVVDTLDNMKIGMECSHYYCKKHDYGLMPISDKATEYKISSCVICKGYYITETDVIQMMEILLGKTIDDIKSQIERRWLGNRIGLNLYLLDNKPPSSMT